MKTITIICEILIIINIIINIIDYKDSTSISAILGWFCALIWLIIATNK
jgi:hypothetical protein